MYDSNDFFVICNNLTLNNEWNIIIIINEKKLLKKRDKTMVDSNKPINILCYG